MFGARRHEGIWSAKSRRFTKTTKREGVWSAKTRRFTKIAKREGREGARHGATLRVLRASCPSPSSRLRDPNTRTPPASPTSPRLLDATAAFGSRSHDGVWSAKSRRFTKTTKREGARRGASLRVLRASRPSSSSRLRDPNALAPRLTHLAAPAGCHGSVWIAKPRRGLEREVTKVHEDHEARRRSPRRAPSCSSCFAPFVIFASS